MCRICAGVEETDKRTMQATESNLVVSRLRNRRPRVPHLGNNLGSIGNVVNSDPSAVLETGAQHL